MYTEKVMEYFKHPKNMGDIKDADGVGKVGNPVCGDVMWLYIKIDEKDGKKYIKDIKFSTFGCVAAIATSSAVTEFAKGEFLDDLLKITKDDIVKKLGDLPQHKIHCSLLAVDALSEALFDYMSKNKMEIPEKIKKKHELLSRELNG